MPVRSTGSVLLVADTASDLTETFAWLGITVDGYFEWAV